MADAPNYKTDKLYQALKKALAEAATPYERDSVQAVITNLRHECAWADKDSPLEELPDPVSGVRTSILRASG